MNQKKVLFLCTGNSCRSQMAEGLLRHWGGNRYQVYSAGIQPREIDPRAVKVMEEIGIDTSQQYSKSVKQFIDQEFDYVITVCDQARQICPIFPGRAQTLHWSIKDPAEVKGSEEEQLQVFRQVRDKIVEKIKEFLSSY